MHQPECTDGKLNGISFDTSGRKFHVFLVYRILNIDRSDAITGHLDRIEPKAHGITLLSPNTYTTDIGDCLQLFFYGKVCYLAQFQQRTFITL